MSSRLTVTIATKEGKVLFVGTIPDDDIQIVHRPGMPSTATMRLPLKDLTDDLRSQVIK